MMTDSILVRCISERFIGNACRGKESVDEVTKKRLRAGSMLFAGKGKGKGPAEVALSVEVVRQTVYTWKGLLDEGGIDARQLAQLRQALLQNPTEHGFGAELWTLINCMYGVKFGQTLIWRILGKLGFSAQKPDRRAIERNEEALRHWKRHIWPAPKKRPNARAKAD